MYQPDFGFLTDAMRFEDGADMPVGSELIQPAPRRRSPSCSRATSWAPA